MKAVEINNLNYWYPETQLHALKNINLSINKGEFVLICGPSGSGKSTLLRALNRLVPDFYGGKISGSVYFFNKNIRECSKKEIVEKAGMVYQHPEKQIVFQDVEREIAFGLENLNTDINKMKRNVAEVISFLNLGKLVGRSTFEISGGEKQKIAVGSVIAMDPEMYIFDEPVSQLDPIAAEDILNCVRRLNLDMGKTIVMVEQRLDKCYEMADKIVYMENGSIKAIGSPHEIPENIRERYYLPTVGFIFKAAGFKEVPVNIKDAKKIIEDMDIMVPERKPANISEEILSIKNLNFEYEKGKKVIDNISLTLKKGEITSVMGENGAGKSTLFKIISGIIEKYDGDIKINDLDIKQLGLKERIGMVGYLSQNPNDYLGRDTVFEEVGYTLKNTGRYSDEKVIETIKKLQIENVKDRNPRDLSGGERQKVAIACTIVSEPEILILDEPTRGMDSVSKENLGRILQSLAKEGKTIIIITHDTDFAADYSNRAVLMFGGRIVAQGDTYDIMPDAIYYTPQVARMFKGKCKVIKTYDAVQSLAFGGEAKE